jgi:hypothetical protein
MAVGLDDEPRVPPYEVDLDAFDLALASGRGIS